ncbi:uncharacterized protein LOC124205943 [Daphnia pulex]|uniref:uncharacterized protein LOC124205943 n=1 Tax=Daphnia pulex TaxID=6669 RepID=UPI001EDF283F|nr:uncharacterized protein LOC124205943 [Daphnia pulex]XP_046459496.1 uncharacterized protein LOC124205943 [Daphnia pulex]
MIELVAASIIIKPDRLLWRCWAVTASILLVLPLSATAVGLVHPGCECVEYSSTFGQPFGQFTSPDFPKPYDPGIGCVLYTFTAPVPPAPSSVGGTIASSWIVELTITSLNLPQTATCGDGDHLSLYLHLDRGEVNERTPSNGRVCSMPAKRSGRYGNTPLRYYSAKSTLVLAFHTGSRRPPSQPGVIAAPAVTANQQQQQHGIITSPTADHHGDGSTFWSSAANGNTNSSSLGPYGFKGTYRFIRKSKFRSDGQRIAGSACDYQFISIGGGVSGGSSAMSRHSNQQQQQPANKFYSPLYPSLYPARSRCLYHFYGRYQERVKIHFEKLILGDEDVSCLWSEDGVKVYDGGDVQSPVIAHLCGVIHHAEIWSSSPSLLVEFYSSNSSEHTFEGFEARYNFLPAARGSDEEDDIIDDDDEDMEEEEDDLMVDPPGVTAPSTLPALITATPIVVSTTPSSTTTRRRTIPTTSRTITLSRPINTTTTPSIRRAAQTASTRPTTTTTRTPTTTPTTTQPTTAKSTTITPSKTTKSPPITGVTTDSSDNQSNLGLDTNSSSPCDRLFRSDVEKNGTFTSPGYPAAYSPSMNCNYEFRGHGRERVQIIFTDFVLHHPHDDPSEKPHHPWLRQSCDGADRVTAFISVGGNKEKIDDFCGSGTPRELMSNSAVMSLHFHSTAVSRGSRGFKARYSFVSNFGITTGEQISSSPCAFRFNSTTSTNGTFWSPNFPGFYPRDTECHYFFHAQVGERVKIVFSYFDIEGMVPCGLTSASDFVEVSNFMTVDRKLPRYCGLQKDLKMESDGAFFRVTFKSNDRFDGTGFYASYQFTPVADAVTITRRRSSSPASSSPYPAGCILLFYLLAYLIS